MHDWPQEYDVWPPEFHRSKVLVSRKERVCQHCHKPIHVGERYRTLVWKDEQGFHTEISHPHDCLAEMEAAQLAEEKQWFA
jgi:hypothetical protein